MTLIPRRKLFGNPERAFALVSPDGRQIAGLAPVAGVMNIVVAPLAAADAVTPVTHETGRGISHCVWAFDGVSLLYRADRQGDENWHVYRVSCVDGEVVDLTPGEQLRASILDVSPRYPNQVLVEIQSADAAASGCFRIRLDTGERDAVAVPAGFARLLYRDFQPRIGVRPRADGGSDWYWLHTDTPQHALAIPAEDSMTTWPVDIGAGNSLYLVDSRLADTAVLAQLKAGQTIPAVLFRHDEADVCDVIIDQRSRTPLALAINTGRKQWQALDAGIAAEFDYLQGRCHGDISLASRTPDDHHWIVGYQADTAPTRFYHYDRRKRESRYLFSNSRALEALQLQPMQPQSIRARDGLELTAYLTRPESAGPGPMILLVHGGPWARDEWGYQPWHQWLANRGYAVLSVNYRGSAGFGKAFLNAGNRQWGRAMQTDLLDAVDWAVAQGIADPDRLAIMGSSYGGYATLAGLAFSPQTFACGVDLMGPSQLSSLLAAIPPQWQHEREMFRYRVGDHESAAGRAALAAVSPLDHVAAITKPLLVVQGAHDPRVPRAESDRMVAALQARNIPVIYLLFTDEGHGLMQPDNRLAFCAIAEIFLAQYLGGKTETADKDLSVPALQILAGREWLPETVREYFPARANQE